MTEEIEIKLFKLYYRLLTGIADKEDAHSLKEIIDELRKERENK